MSDQSLIYIYIYLSREPLQEPLEHLGTINKQRTEASQASCYSDCRLIISHCMTLI